VRHARRVALAAEITRLFAKHRGTYGSPRITADLAEAGWKVSVNTVAALMRQQHLVARAGHRRRSTARQGADRWRAPDLIGRHFAVARVNEKWYGDGTEIATDEGKLFLDSVLDMGSRRIVGFALGEHHDADLSYSALSMAIAIRGGRDAISGVIMHTDQGSEFTAGRFREACTRCGMNQSMGRPGSGLDNAVIESRHSTLEFELRSLEHFSTREQARKRVAEWIDEYNTVRRHSALQMISPMAWELARNQDEQKAAKERKDDGWRRRLFFPPAAPLFSAVAADCAGGAPPPQGSLRDR